MSFASSARWIAPLAALALGCGPARSGGGFPESCTPAATRPCFCADSTPSAQTCGGDAVWGACACGDASTSDDAVVAVDVPATFDTGPRPDVVFPVDVPATQDLGAPVDVPTVAPGAFGAACTRLTDCASGVCLPTGHCSRACAGGADCTAIAGWVCSALPGLGPVCSCTPRGVEVCNGLDDDCNGLVDEGTSMCGGRCADISRDPANCGACGNVCGSGACAGGVCACPGASPNRCGGACVNTNTDPSDCGACGTVCPSGPCVSGRCQGTTPVCPATCGFDSDCNPCRSPSDPGTVNYCCTSGMCVYRTTTCGPIDSGLPDVTDVPDSSTGLDIGDLDALFDAAG